MSARPEKIGKYQVLDVAGRGAMGVVYMGHDPFIDRRVAIKVSTQAVDGADGALSRKMFFNEAQSAGALDHPNILKVYDAGESEEAGAGHLYIVIEYVDGSDTLRSYTNKDKLLPIETVLQYMEQCALALDYAHRRGVLHKDIKPANIMLTTEGQAKIGDFGIAQRTQVDYTQAQGAFGSPLYMSPEQLGDETLTQQTDLYSLGVTMYQLLAGRAPFESKTVAKLALMVTTEEAPGLCELRPELPEAVEAVVKKAMEKDLEDRFKSGAEMAAAIAKVREHYARPQDEHSEEERFVLARDLPFFNEFSDSELEEVLEVATWERHLPGETLIREGSMEESFFVIASGDVEVVVGGRVIGTLSAGDCVGEIGYLAQMRRSANITARTDVTAIRVDGALVDWASIPVQMRFNKAFQRTLVERLLRTTMELAKHVA